MRFANWTIAVIVLALGFSGAVRAESPGKFAPPLGEPVPGGGGAEWSTSAISNLPSQTRLGALWASDTGNLYVLGVRPMAAALATPEDSRRESDPRDPAESGISGYPPQLSESTVYFWNGDTWASSLTLLRETAVSVYGAGRNVFVASNSPGGGVRVRMLAGHRWIRTDLPASIRGPAGSFAGEGRRIYFRAGDAILRLKDLHWKLEYRNAGLVGDGAEGIVYVARDEVLAYGALGHAAWNGRDWKWATDCAASCRCGAWGARDPDGVSHVFVAGEDTDELGPCVWGYDSEPGILQLMLADIPADPVYHTGDGQIVWGAAAHDVFATGLLKGKGHLYHFNGEQWSRIDPMQNMPPLGGVSGTKDGLVVVSLADGRVLSRGTAIASPAPKDQDALPVASLADLPMQLSVFRETGGAAIVEFSLAQPAEVSVAFFDLAGRRVGTVDRSVQPAGTQRVRWEPGGLPSGVYFCQVKAGDRIASRSVAIVR